MSAPTIVPPFAVDFAYQSPFAAPAPASDVAEDAPEGSYTYALVASGPAIAEAECEAQVEASRDPLGRLQLDSKGASSTAMSALVHLGLLGALALFTPPMSLDQEAVVAEDQRYLIQQALQASAERELIDGAAPLAREGDAGESRDATSLPAPGAAGAAGNPAASPRASGRVAVKGPEHEESPRLGRHEALRMAQDFGMIGILASAPGGDPDAPTSRWGAEDSSGRDALSARGNMWAREVGDGAGPGGLSLTGIGDGSNGDFTFIGMAGVRTLGDDGVRDVLGRPGRTLKEHAAVAPNVRTSPPITTGTLPPELIQRTVRQSFGRFRACYETGLRGNPSLAGRVSVRFVIGRDGSVSSVGSGGSDMPDAGVVSCVTRSFYGLSFAAPESGIVTVVYPIVFTPGA